VGKRYGYAPNPDYQHLDFADVIDSVVRGATTTSTTPSRRTTITVSTAFCRAPGGRFPVAKNTSAPPSFRHLSPPARSRAWKPSGPRESPDSRPNSPRCRRAGGNSTPAGSPVAPISRSKGSPTANLRAPRGCRRDRTRSGPKHRVPSRTFTPRGSAACGWGVACRPTAFAMSSRTS
jgi:hypothetical protein